MNSTSKSRPKSRTPLFDQHRVIAVLVVSATTIFCLALRICEDSIDTARVTLLERIVRAFPKAHLYYWASVAVDVPFALLNAVVVALIFAVSCVIMKFRSRVPLWRYGLAIGVVSELAWVALWRAFVCGADANYLLDRWSILDSIIYALAYPLVALCVEDLRSRKRLEKSVTH